MALEYAPAKIRINAVAPTVIETETVHGLIDGDVTESLAKVGLSPCNPLVGPGDSLPQVEDVTGVVAFLCGPESKFINGAVGDTVAINFKNRETFANKTKALPILHLLFCYRQF